MELCASNPTLAVAVTTLGTRCRNEAEREREDERARTFVHSPMEPIFLVVLRAR